MAAVGYAQPVNLHKVIKLVAQVGHMWLARRLDDTVPPEFLDEYRIWVSRVEFQFVEYLVATGLFLPCF